MDGDETRRSVPPPLRAALPPAQTAPDLEQTAPDQEQMTPEPEQRAQGPAQTAPEPGRTDPERTATEEAAEPGGADAGPDGADATGRHRAPHRRRIGGLRAPGLVARPLAAWARQPSGRLALPGLLLATAVAAVAAAGGVLVPATAKRAAPAADAASPAPAAPTTGDLPTAPPTIAGTLAPTPPVTGRPADALRSWAAQLSVKVDVPVTALEAYGYAELVLSQTTPGCGLKWTTLAAIGKVESNHGSANDATLLADGRSVPEIYGAPLDGTGGTMKIEDTDGGVLDGDLTWDRAVGPMQFIPSTWATQAVDADNDGVNNPGDIDDAALAAANYLCAAGRDLNQVGDWWAAILTYNDVQRYARDVYQAANEYGAKSRT